MTFREIALLCLLVDRYNPNPPSLIDQMWSREFSLLMKRGYVDIHGEPTKKGRSKAYFFKNNRIIFDEEASRRGMRYSIAMTLGGLKGIQSNLGQEPELEERFFETLREYEERILPELA